MKATQSSVVVALMRPVMKPFSETSACNGKTRKAAKANPATINWDFKSERTSMASDPRSGYAPGAPGALRPRPIHNGAKRKNCVSVSN